MTYKLVKIDVTPCGNGLPEIRTTLAVSNNNEKLETYCNEMFGVEVGKPKTFSWDIYFIIEETDLFIL